MHTGMLWFDDSKITIESKIQKATEYYKKKYGQTPDICMVHPSLLENGTPEIEGMTIRPYPPVLPGHVWIGIEDKE